MRQYNFTLSHQVCVICANAQFRLQHTRKEKKISVEKKIYIHNLLTQNGEMGFESQLKITIKKKSEKQ